jgi:putative hydrolase of HD superfamily
MIEKKLIEHIYTAARIQRWNDHPRPIEFTELDKQAHKMIIAYVIAMFEEESGEKVNWQGLIEGGIFEFFQRVMLTDLKPEVYHQLMSEKGRELNAWVFGQLEPEMKSIKNGFFSRFVAYYNDAPSVHREKRILKAAHYLATQWEFKFIYRMAPFLYGIDKRREMIEYEITEHYDLNGVREILRCRELYGFIDLCGQLRFQQRWAQTPRIPRTYVLGHMLVVAMLAYFFSIEMGFTSPVRLRNNFFSGLFHDLPEVLTKDIVSPVKSMVQGLDLIITEFEEKQVKEKLLPLLPEQWHDEIRYFIRNEFNNKYRLKDEVVVSTEDIPAQYAADACAPLDGRVIEVCDKYSAFIEASLSAQYGIHSRELSDGMQKIFDRFHTARHYGIDFHPYFDYFK